MRIAKDFLREAIQFVATKRPLIAFKNEEGVTDKKLGESRMYKICEAGTKRIKHGQHGCCMHPGTGSTEIGTLTALNNKQATFEEQTLENLEHCLNAVAVQVFPNKAYKLQKWYI
eukprot:69101-Ditylum_brightwellii.AAC.1